MNAQDQMKTLWAVTPNTATKELINELPDQIATIRVFQTYWEMKSALKTEPAKPDMCILEMDGEDEYLMTLFSMEQFISIPDESVRKVLSINSSSTLLLSDLNGETDFLVAPFNKEELILRTTLMLEREKSDSGKYKLNDKTIEIDPKSLTLALNGTPSPTLTSREFQIVNILCNEPGAKIPCKEIMKQVWGKNVVCPKTLHVHIHNLRKKLQSLGIGVLHTPPSGYSLIEKAMPAPISQPVHMENVRTA